MLKKIVAVLLLSVVSACYSVVPYRGPHGSRPYVYQDQQRVDRPMYDISLNPRVNVLVHVVNPFLDQYVKVEVDCVDSMWVFSRIPPMSEQLVLVETSWSREAQGPVCAIQRWSAYRARY